MGGLTVNGSHQRSISRRLETRQPWWSRPIVRNPLAALLLAGSLAPAPGRASCTQALQTPEITARPLQIIGTTPAATTLALLSGRTYLIEIREQGNDAVGEILDSNGRVLVRTDHPERRTGTRRAIATAPESASVIVRVTGKEDAAGSATVLAFDLASIRPPECAVLLKTLAAADADYALGQQISKGRAAATGQSAREAFLRSAAGYSAAEHALGGADDPQLRGETALALAALNYQDLQDWVKAADWAKAAASTLETDDLYRRARAEALLGAAWIEIGSAAPVGQSAKLLGEARRLLRDLSRFHLQRGEPYEAGLQLTNIGLTYLYQGRYPECMTASAAASRLFASIHETLRSAQAWQNRALCLWGLGRLREARDAFEHSLADIGPEALPRIYLGSITNTALLDYALGHFDESMRLFDGALGVAQRTQAERDAAYCLYGIGVNYRALGDPERARDFLERSLSIRTVALDGRGRMDSLRALASVAAAQGREEEAIGFAREALTLAVDPLATESISVQLASYTATAGHLEEAKSLLDKILKEGPRGDPLILAEALVQRAVILRRVGQSRAALADLERALRRFQALSSVTEEFVTNVELARTLRSAGKPQDALAAVDRALARADAVRLQSINLDFRAQLQAPLRAAYDLKIDLLWTDYQAAVTAGAKQEADALAAKAFSTADVSRARSFADLATQRYSAAVRRELASEFRRREEIYRELAARRFALDSLTDLSPAHNPRAKQLMSDIGELERQADTVNTVIATRASHESGEGAKRRSIPSIPVDTAFVSFWLGAESSYAWVVLPGEIHWLRLASPATIAERAVAFHDSLTRLVDRPLEQRLTDAARLSELIVEPLEPWLSSVNRWIVVPDGALDYVPFGALQMSTEPRSFVVLHHDVALTPAAWMLDTRKVDPRPDDERSLLLVADPVYQADDPRLAALRTTVATQKPVAPPLLEFHEYRRLPFTAEEAATIRREFSAAEVDQLIGLEATRERLLSLDLSKYRFIHIAAHGVVDTQVPELSALMLGSYDTRGNVVDGAVRVSDLALQTLTADVAVFSACDTAFGRAMASEGLVGIGSTVLARGARAVVASLWPVPDEIGARLMTEFYRHLLRDSMSAPAALAAAMRTVVSREGVKDPALWASFQVSVTALGPSQPYRSAGSRITARRESGGMP